MRLIVDRIEEDVIVAEMPDMTFVNLPRAVAPKAKEGDQLVISVRRADPKLREEIEALENKLFEKRADK